MTELPLRPTCARPRWRSGSRSASSPTSCGVRTIMSRHATFPACKSWQGRGAQPMAMPVWHLVRTRPGSPNEGMTPNMPVPASAMRCRPEEAGLGKVLPPIPAGFLDIPGPMGDLACYLRDVDPVSDEVRALALAIGVMMALGNGAFKCVSGAGLTTYTDLIVVNVDDSASGKTTQFNRIQSILARVIDDPIQRPFRHQEAWVAGGLLGPARRDRQKTWALRHHGDDRRVRWRAGRHEPG